MTINFLVYDSVVVNYSSLVNFLGKNAIFRYVKIHGPSEFVSKKFQCRICGSEMKFCRQNIYAHMKVDILFFLETRLCLIYDRERALWLTPTLIGF